MDATPDLSTITGWLKSARIFDLGRPMVQGMPQSPSHPPFRMALERRHGDRERPGGDSAANEMIVTGGHVGTHIDALAHYSHEGRLFGGVSACEAQTGGRFLSHGAETLPMIVGRGILIDVPAALGEAAARGDVPLDAAAVDEALRVRGTTPRPGDAVLIRTGWGRRWDDAAAFLDFTGGVPGPDVGGIDRLLEGRPVVMGSDTLAFEHLPPGRGLTELPGHRRLLVEAGVPIIEMLDLEELAAAGVREFVFVLAPLKLVGATASPVRPLALVAG
ncbi:cyclase [Skermanella stibiiresistens SB22]|uniref:Cyclase n=1 Tax=Skermanella stibiiresistens SB22 TaxID=1385369 RepID=W9H3T0_9PROT|nr:cyclase family protein [Skermanella stibiiresistens]EWY40694.1 cyclase [Skermanella stibiiresistens SB22]